MAGISLKQAKDVVQAAAAKAEEIGVPMNVAVVDAGNNLTAFARQDGAWLGSIDIAQSKAYTARAFDMSTKDLAPEAQPGGSLYGIGRGQRRQRRPGPLRARPARVDPSLRQEEPTCHRKA